MKQFLIIGLSLFSFSALADVPQPVVEFASAVGGYATISGRLDSTSRDPIGVTVEMGGLKYTTISDPNGKWSVVVKYRSTNYTVNSFNLMNSNERSEIHAEKLK